MKKSKKVTILTVILSVIIVIISLFTIRYLVYKKDINEIESIEISKTYYYPHSEYKYFIDFSEDSVLHETYTYEKEETFYTRFTDKQIKEFVRKANLYGFFGWKESYHANVDDGKGVDICITFKDGSVKETNCFNKFPLTYDIMAGVFEETFGYNML